MAHRKRGVRHKKHEFAKSVAFFHLFRYATRQNIILTVFGCLCAAVCGIARIVDLFVFGKLINSFVVNKKAEVSDDKKLKVSEEAVQEALMYFSLGMGAIALTQLIFGYLAMLCLNISADRQLFHIRCLFFKSVLRQEIAWFDAQHSTDFANTSVENLNDLRNGIGEKLGLCCYFTTIFITGSIIALARGWKLGLVALSVTPVLVVSTLLLARMQTNLANEELEAYAGAGSIAEETLFSIRTVVAFNGEEKARNKYESSLVNASKSGRKLRLISALGNGIAWFFSYISYTISFWYGVQLMTESEKENTHEYNAASIIIVFFAAIIGSLHFTRLGPNLEAVLEAKGAAPAIYNTIERIPTIDSLSPLGYKPATVKGKIQFNNIYFVYSTRPDVTILSGVSIVINPGQSVAFVGSSGCGKSTLLQLLLRFYTPVMGDIKLDEINIQKLNLGWLRDQIGVVGQEPSLFAMSIKDNIQLGCRQTLTDKEIEAAAKAANCHDFIMKLPQRYYTILGERGTKLSGGQKQRIAIARALAKNPKILLLDEPTSALDMQSEAVVQEALNNASANRTTIIVAHRLSTIQHVDTIFVLHQGRILEVGNHVELLKINGLYVQMLKSQMEKEEEEEEIEEEVEEFKDDTQKVERRISIFEKPSLQLLEVERKVKAPFRKVIRLSSKDWYLLLLGCIGSVGFGCSVPCYAVLVGELMRILSIVDHEQAVKEAKMYSAWFAAVGVGAGLFIFMEMYFFALAGEKLTLRLRKGVFLNLLKQEIGWFDNEKNGTGALCTRLASDAYNVQAVTGARLGAMLQTSTCLLVSISLALYYVWQQTLVTICVMPVIFVGIYLESIWTQKQAIAERESLQMSGKIAIETINNIRTVAYLYREDTFLELYVKSLRSSEKKLIIPTHIHGLLFGSVHAIMSLSYILCLRYGSYLVTIKEAEYHDIFRVGELVVFGTMMVATTIASAPSFEKGLISAGKIFELLDRKPIMDIESKQNIQEPTITKADVEFEGVKFSYPTRSTVSVLTDFSCKITAGKTLALIGSSGCGKSTCIQLLERFYDPQVGEIKLGGYDIKVMNLRWLRSQLGLVSQEPILFDDTIAENIAYGDNSREVNMEEIIDAAKHANIHNFIITLPEGYDTNVGQKGTQLSGGQKQRIAIARSLIRNPKVLLLDEATSALDIESEKIVQEALDKAMVGRTCIVIAHRLSTIQNAHLIMYMHEGKIIEQGTHLELMAKKGCYYHLRKTPSRPPSRVGSPKI